MLCMFAWRMYVVLWREDGRRLAALGFSLSVCNPATCVWRNILQAQHACIVLSIYSSFSTQHTQHTHRHLWVCALIYTIHTVYTSIRTYTARLPQKFRNVMSLNIHTGRAPNT
jgi:hypothetical protein